MGSGGHNPSGSGQDFATVQASAGQAAQLDLHALWMHKDNNMRVTVDDGEPVLLRGTVLPPADGGGRRFRSKPGGKIELMLVTNVLTSLSFVSLEISATCGDSSGCGGHGSCSGGNCTCSGGYSGMGACAPRPACSHRFAPLPTLSLPRVHALTNSLLRVSRLPVRGGLQARWGRLRR
eukprot:COSAG06_NODE_855_length_11931_cov_20.218813_10_plen_178_part_00